MKSPIITDNGRRTKTNPDQSSLISYSTVKSYASSERKTQVKVACKVLCEMREDESSKLSMKFTQLRIVLATQSLLHKLQKYKSSKLQTYFWILQQERKTIQHNGFLDLNQTISLPPVMDDLSNNQIRDIIQQQMPTSTVIILRHLLNKLINEQQRIAFKNIRTQSNFNKGIIQIINLIKNNLKRSYYLGILNIMRCNQNRKVLKTSVLDQDQEVSLEYTEMEEQNIQKSKSEEMSMKEQLAIKFASITILTSILNEKIQKQQFQLFFNIIRNHYQFNKQLSFSQINEITQINEQPFFNQNNNIIQGTQLLCRIINYKLKDYFQEITKNQSISRFKNDDDYINVLQQNTISDQQINNSYEDLYTQRVLSKDQEQDENEIVENINSFKMPCSLQHIADIDDIYDTHKVGEQLQDKVEIQQQKLIVEKKNKHQDLIKNAVKCYCTQSQMKQSIQETPKIQQPLSSKKQEEHKQLYILHIIGICMIVFIILILQ